MNKYKYVQLLCLSMSEIFMQVLRRPVIALLMDKVWECTFVFFLYKIFIEIK